MSDNEDTIRRRAGEIWEAEGRPEGRAPDHWFQAKEELSNQKALGAARYSAWQSGSIVTTQATGVLPGRGYRASLEPNRIQHGDPWAGNAFAAYMLVFRESRADLVGGPVPFTIQAQFEYRGSVFELLVLDRDGEHRLYPNGR